MQIGSLVKTNGHPHAGDYPKGVGVVVAYRDEGLHKMYNSVRVVWVDVDVERPIRQQFLDIVCE